MKLMGTTTPGRRRRAGVCLGGAVALLSGCGGGTPAEPPVTITTTPTVTVTLARRTPTGAPSPTGNPKSDDVGRNFDLGTIVRVEEVGGVPVLILNRWTARGVSDSKVADRGVPIKVHSDTRFEDNNTNVTYRIPVAPGATFAHLHCVDSNQPAERKPSTLKDFARLRDPENVVLLTLDSRGRVTKGRNDPAC